ncbi:MAG: short-chain dehydrogenase [Mesorhizobium amorphae]|nr:MAG: short-chain dehydrogenase [Mesorhizobium amorphae]
MAEKRLRFEGRYAVVTAAASGIGRATVSRLLDEGARVVGLDIGQDVLDPNPFNSSNYRGIVADCTSEESIVAAFRDIQSDGPAIDILVNAVGRHAGPKRSEFAESTSDTWDDVLRVTLRSCMLCSRQALGSMKARGTGRIISVSSVVWTSPTIGLADYAAAKAGVVGFSRVLAAELGPHGVTVNTVSPGAIETPATASHSAEVRGRLLAQVPLGRYGQPSDIAAGIAFLASDDASYITGHNLVISGGRAMS